MKVILIGATGIIGQAVSQALTGQHEVIPVSRSKGEYPVDLADKASIQKLFETVAPFDAVIYAVGAAKFAPLANLSDDDFQFSLANKLMGQVNVVRVRMDFINGGGSFTLTSGVLAQQPMPGSAAISLVNAGRICPSRCFGATPWHPRECRESALGERNSNSDGARSIWGNACGASCPSVCC